ncbi:MAG: plastocyanin/azurin family copper-binding protein [Patescibacteria group bacterium]|mgnify:CR=1 FL=1
MRKTIIIIVVILVVGFGIFYIVSNNSQTYTPPVSNNQQTNMNPVSNAPAISSPNTSATPVPLSATISIKNFSFDPTTLTIKSGTKVTWTNDDSVTHTITSDSGSLLNSGTISPGQSFSFIFTNIGTENYHCSIHTTMRGNIIVQ